MWEILLAIAIRIPGLVFGLIFIFCYPALDKLLINTLEYITQPIEAHIGIDNFLLSKIMLIFGFTIQIAHVVIYWDNAMATLDHALTGVTFSLLGIQLVTSFNEYRNNIREKVKSELAQGLRNYLKHDSDALSDRRMLLLLVLFYYVIAFLIPIPLLTFSVLLLYLGNLIKACDPLPPGGSKLKNLITAIKQWYRSTETVPTES